MRYWAKIGKNGMVLALLQSLQAIPASTPPPSPPGTPRRLQGADVQHQCDLQGLFGRLQAITADERCRTGCNEGTGTCGEPWYPSSRDVCNADCGRLFEPFWDECGDVLLNANMVRRDGTVPCLDV